MKWLEIEPTVLICINATTFSSFYTLLSITYEINGWNEMKNKQYDEIQRAIDW